MPRALTSTGCPGEFRRRGEVRDGTDARDDVWVVALLIFTVMLTSLSLAITLCFLTEEAPTSTLTWLICVG